MSPLSEELNQQIEPYSGLASNEGPRGGARGSSKPSTAGFEPGRPNRRAAPMINLIRCSTAEPGVRPVEVVPREVERQLLFESSETELDDAQASSAFVLDSSNPTLNHRQAPILPQSPESMSKTV